MPYRLKSDGASHRPRKATRSVALRENEGASEAEASLGKLVKFDLRPRIASDRAEPPGDAQILMFTGVRYERQTPQPPGQRRSPAGKKQTRG
jgi:hypothetical protein